jgi:hypothetical protein
MQEPLLTTTRNQFIHSAYIELKLAARYRHSYGQISTRSPTPINHAKEIRPEI